MINTCGAFRDLNAKLLAEKESLELKIGKAGGKADSEVVEVFLFRASIKGVTTVTCTINIV
jgi:hypothetical protein